MYYLSRMGLNGQRRCTAQFLSNPQKMHAAVESCFYTEDSLENPRSLWRIEQQSRNITLWIMSNQLPAFEHIQEQAGWSTTQTWETREYDLLLNRLMRGQQYQFRLTANPTKETLCGDGKKRRLGIFREDEQIQWLLNREEQLGVCINKSGQPTFSIAQSNRLSFYRGKGSKVTLQKCQYDGLLEVHDVEKLQLALTNGVGKAKAYGCGLLTLAPVVG